MSTGTELVDTCGGLWPSYKLTVTAAEQIARGPLRDFLGGDISSALTDQFNADPDARSPNWKAARAALYTRRRVTETAPKGDGADWVRSWLRNSDEFEPRFELCHSDIGPLALELWFDVVSRDMAYGGRYGTADPNKFRGEVGQQRMDKLVAARHLLESRGAIAESWEWDWRIKELETHMASRTASLAELERRAKQLKLPGPKSNEWHRRLFERIGHEWNRLGTRYEAFPEEAEWKDEAPW